MSGQLENLRGLLRQGYTPGELVAQGYPKSSVYKAAQQLRRGGSRASYTRFQAEDILVEYSPYYTEAEVSSAVEARAINEPTVQQEDTISWIDQQYERLRIEREAREAAIAEEQARREQVQKVENARARLFKNAIAAHRAGQINNYELITVTSGRKTLADIESGENLLRGLVANTSIRLQREASQAAIAEEQAKREQARREQVQKVENARARLLKKAVAAHDAGKIDFHQLLLLTTGRDSLEDIEEAENALRLLKDKPFTH